MTKNEKEALIEYAEFGMLSLCDSVEAHLSPDKHGFLVDQVLGFLLDLEDSIEMHILLEEKQNP